MMMQGLARTLGRRTSLAPRTSSRLLPSVARQRGFSAWTSAKVQETLNQNPLINECIVDDTPTAHVVPVVVGHAGYYGLSRHAPPDQEELEHMHNLDEEVVNDMLEHAGYDGPTIPVSFKTEIELWMDFFDAPEVHKRVVLRDVVRVVFEAADTDADDSITFIELVEWVEGQKVGMENVSEAFLKYDDDEFGLGGYGYSDELSFGEFKRLLLGEGLITVNEGEGEGRLLIQSSLLDVVAKEFFKKADADDDGEITKAEVGEVLKSYQLVSDTSLEESFAKIDTDGNGTISLDEFKAFLLDEGVLEVAPTPPQSESKSVFGSLFGWGSGQE